jgi:sterol desaturase/sphingolipid hydroxylase (fatty acid hydroxylase superfamily)
MPDATGIGDEAVLRFGIFASGLAALMLAERVMPARRSDGGLLRRWTANLALGAVSSLVLRVLLPGAVIVAAAFAAMRGWGALNQVAWPWALEFAMGFLALDLAIYAQHVATHRVPLLWRLHRVHHADVEIDVTTALRFHPVEILLSQVWKIAVAMALGVGPWTVLVFEIVLNGAAMFNHANLRVPPGWDRVLRWILVTPDMHAIHHSQRRQETDSNFGFCLSLWDRVFGTYRAAPVPPFAIGQMDVEGARASALIWCLFAPFGKAAR